jgi:hypothetical protein
MGLVERWNYLWQARVHWISMHQHLKNTLQDAIILLVQAYLKGDSNKIESQIIHLTILVSSQTLASKKKQRSKLRKRKKKLKNLSDNSKRLKIWMMCCFKRSPNLKWLLVIPLKNSCQVTTPLTPNKIFTHDELAQPVLTPKKHSTTPPLNPAYPAKPLP